MKRRVAGKVGIDGRRQWSESESLVPLPGLVGQQPFHDIGDHRLPRPRPHVVGAGEVASDRIDLRLLPLELVEAFHRQSVGRGDRHRREPDRKQRFAQLRARQPELAHVEVVDGVDAVRNEGALAPVEHVPAEARIDNCVACVERPGEVGVEHFDILAHAILRRVAQRCTYPGPVLVLEVDESGGPDERAEVAGAYVEVRREFRSVADDAAAVVEIAVIAVGVGGQFGVALLDADGHAVRERGVQASLERAVAELEPVRRRRMQETAKGEGACRQGDRAARDGRGYPPPTRRSFRRSPHPLRMERAGRARFNNISRGVPLSRLVRPR